MSKMLRCLWILAALCLILLLALPTLLSTSWGNQLLLWSINSRIAGKISAQDIDLQWFGGQKIEEMELRSLDDAPLLKIKELSTQASLWRLLFLSGYLGQIQIDSPQVTLVFDEKGISNFKTTLGSLRLRGRKRPSHVVFAATSPLLEQETARGEPLFPNIPTGTFVVKNGSIHFIRPNTEEIIVRGVNFDLTIAQDRSELTLKGGAQASQGEVQGGLSTHLVLSRTDEKKGGALLYLSSVGFPMPAPGVAAEGTLSMQNIPVGIIGQLISLKFPPFLGFSPQLLGKSFSLTANLKGEGPQAELIIDAKSPFSTLHLEKKEAIDANFSIQNAKMAHPLLGEVTVNSLKAIAAVPASQDLISFEAATQLQEKEASFEASVKGTLNNIINDKGKVDFRNAKSDIHLETRNFPMAVLERVTLQSPGQWSQVVGDIFSVDINIAGSWNLFNIATTLRSPHLDLNPTIFNVGDLITLSAPTSFTLHLTPQGWKRLAHLEERFILSEEAKIDVAIDKLSFPRISFDQPFPWRKLLIVMRAATPHLSFNEIPGLRKMIFENNRFILDGAKGQGKFASTLEALFPAESSKINKLLGAGAPLTLDGEYFFDEKDKVALPRLHFLAQGRHLLLEAVLSYRLTQDSLVRLLAPLTLEYIVTPELLAGISPYLASKGSLRSPFAVRIKADDFEAQEANGEWVNLGMNTSFTITPVELVGALNPELRDLKGVLNFELVKGSAQLHVSGLSTFSGADTTGGIQLDATAESLFFHEGALDMTNAAIDCEGSLKDFPVAALEILVSSPAVPAIFGSKINATLATHVHQRVGSFDLHVASDLSQLDLAGLLNQGTLTLRDPLEAKITITPILGETILQYVNPFLLTAFRAENPTRFHIEKEGFSLPLLPFQPREIQIGKARTDFGKVWVKNRGPVKLLLELFKSSSLNAQEELQVWTTPVYLSITKGVVNYARSDMLIGNDLQTAFWGRINLYNKNLTMTIAIPGWSLKKLLGVADMGESYYLLIPVKGKIPSVSVDWSKASARIAALLARKEPTAGRVIGGVIDVISGHAQEQKKVPSPTTDPFPWLQKP